MAYTQTVWKNGEFPPIDAEHLNKIEQGIANSAPGGYGLGEPPKYIADANDAVNNGWYAITMSTLNLPNGTEHEWDYTYLRVDVGYRPDVYIKQTVTSQYRELRQCEITRCKILGVWQPWEWVNPPMQLGTEYRTTERYLGKPVYAKLVDCGQIADNKQVEHGIVNMRDCTFAQGLRVGMPMPAIYSHNLSDPWSCYIAAVTETKITLACGTSAAGGNCFVILKYTKTTD